MFFSGMKAFLEKRQSKIARLSIPELRCCNEAMLKRKGKEKDTVGAEMWAERRGKGNAEEG